jgi:REP element-mobilizing transposase RayT
MDRYLDTARRGPAHMRDGRIADMVVRAIECGRELRHYELHAYVVMPNHVHILITPLISVVQLIASLKGVSARDANRLLRRVGCPFWQPEYYDHWVRDEKQANRIAGYIEANPVKAGLVIRAEDYEWSSAARRRPETP